MYQRYKLILLINGHMASDDFRVFCTNVTPHRTPVRSQANDDQIYVMYDLKTGQPLLSSLDRHPPVAKGRALGCADERTRSSVILTPFPPCEPKVRPDGQEIDHYGDHVPHDHRPRRNQEAVIDPHDLENTHDARHHRVHTLA